MHVRPLITSSIMSDLKMDSNKTPTWPRSEPATDVLDATDIWKSSESREPVIRESQSARSDNRHVSLTSTSDAPHDGPGMNRKEESGFQDYDEEFGKFQAADPFTEPMYILYDTYAVGDTEASLFLDSDLPVPEGDDDGGYAYANPRARKPLSSHLRDALSSVGRAKEGIKLKVLAAQEQGMSSSRCAVKAWGKYWEGKNSRDGSVDIATQASAAVGDPAQPTTGHSKFVGDPALPTVEDSVVVAERPHTYVEPAQAVEHIGQAPGNQVEPDSGTHPAIDGFMARELACWRE